MREAVITAAVRTPVGKAKGCYTNLQPEELGAVAIKELLKRTNIEPCEIDDVIYSTCRNLDIAIPGHMIGLQAGLPLEIPGFAVDRGCASSLTGFAIASSMIQTGIYDTVIVGGVEHSTRGIYKMHPAPQAFSMAPPSWVEDKITPPEYENLGMGETAERIAQEYGLTREMCDEFSVLSHKRAAAAWADHRFDEQIVPVEIKDRKKGTITITQDESVRPDCSMAGLAKLRPSFRKDGIVTAGNSSGFVDASAAVMVMEKEKAKSLGLPILARFKDCAAIGVQPQIMGIGPAKATEKLLKRNKMTLADIDLIELNEAFASQTLACLKELNLNMDKVNVNGGAIALGHPFGATGAFLLTKLVYEMQRTNAEAGIVTFCIGGGQGYSVLLDRE
ncbi:MAG: thiolase family protein [Eubacterium sp.]|jgi:acetyl-CoA acetyltransferases|nr:thiolase family protein [Eubacterium sp.]